MSEEKWSVRITAVCDSEEEARKLVSALEDKVGRMNAELIDSDWEEVP